MGYFSARCESKLLLAEGGLETELVFHRGLPIPTGGAFTLMDSEAGRGVLLDYYLRYVEIVRLQFGVDTGHAYVGAIGEAQANWVFQTTSCQV